MVPIAVTSLLGEPAGLEGLECQSEALTVQSPGSAGPALGQPSDVSGLSIWHITEARESVCVSQGEGTPQT